MNAIADVQSSKDLRNMPINQVGIKDLRFPIRLKTAAGIQPTVARLTMTVRLPADQKGTHMSRFVALMETQHSALDFDELKNLTQKMLELLDSDAGRICISFPYFRQKSAPVSGIQIAAGLRCDPVRRSGRRSVPTAASFESVGAGNQPVPLLERNFANTARTTSART
jgi:GTP cyclohydrolase FolE2